MRGNIWPVCAYTGNHLGWPPQIVIANLGTDSSWRVERHPRMLADTSGDGRADIIGFGDDGVWLARAAAAAGFEEPEFVIPHYGYGAGWWLVEGWRIESHPRLVTGSTGAGRAAVVAFGDAGVYMSTL